MTQGVNLFAKYETDSVKEKSGVDIDISGAVFTCRRAGGANRKYKLAMLFAAEKHAGVFEMDPKSEAFQEIDNIIVMDAFADCVVLGWSNVLNRDNEPWEFSKENFKELMLACPDVWQLLRNEVTNLENFKLTQVKTASDLVGNE